MVNLLATGEYQERARSLGARLHARLGELVGHGVVAVRSAGLWAGVDIDPAVASGREVCEALMRRGVLAKDTHGATTRLAPPLGVSADDTDWAVDQLAAVLGSCPFADFQSIVKLQSMCFDRWRATYGRVGR